MHQPTSYPSPVPISLATVAHPHYPNDIISSTQSLYHQNSISNDFLPSILPACTIHEHRPLPVNSSHGHPSLPDIYGCDLVLLDEVVDGQRAVILAVPQSDGVVVADTGQEIALLIVLKVGDQFEVGWDSLEFLLPAQVEDGDDVGLSADCQLETIWMELAAEQGVALLDLIDALSCSQVPDHAEPSEIAGEVKRLIGVKRGDVDFFFVSSLSEDFADAFCIPQDPRFIIGRTKEIGTIFSVFDAIDSLTVGFFGDALLLLHLPQQRPHGEVASGGPCQNIRRFARNGANSRVEVHAADLGWRFQGGYL